jgi:short subunit dehydrogenase-like uncharacterized protein
MIVINNQASAPSVTAPAVAAGKAIHRQRKYDVVLYGASGFVGRQTVAYFARLEKLKDPNGKPLRWALAGRSADKLEAVKAAVALHSPGARRAAIVVADAHDAKALNALARDAAVVLSTAGPFALYGSELVAACVANGTHYVDITGETPWVFDMIRQHEAAAVKSGARIIPFCGFDSIPSDLGAWLVATTLQDKHGEPCQSVKAAFSIHGGVNGGTLASMFNFLGTGQAKKLAEPFLLNPPNAKAPSVEGQQDPVTPVFDADFKAWLGPFFMGPINTRVVRRSAALSTPSRSAGRGKAKTNPSSSPYSKDFTYQEYMRFGAGPLAGMAATAFCAGMFSSQQAMRLKPLRQLAKRLAPGPGTGPSEASMDGGSFRCDLVGRSASGHVVRGRVADQGDPGNRATTKMVCEAALCLALQLDELPGGCAKGGFLTPATGLGAVLLKRLRDAGMTLQAT